MDVKATGFMYIHHDSFVESAFSRIFCVSTQVVFRHKLKAGGWKHGILFSCEASGDCNQHTPLFMWAVHVLLEQRFTHSRRNIQLSTLVCLFVWFIAQNV